jgi:hypothetical protein
MHQRSSPKVYQRENQDRQTGKEAVKTAKAVPEKNFIPPSPTLKQSGAPPYGALETFDGGSIFWNCLKMRVRHPGSAPRKPVHAESGSSDR